MAEKPEKMKRAEFVVVSESTWGVERGLDYALRAIGLNNFEGQHRIENHNIEVEWRCMDVNAPPKELQPPLVASQVPEGVPADLPDISRMDIEEAKGFVGVAKNLEELQLLEDYERSSERTSGGRKGVLNYIEKIREEIQKKAAATSEATPEG